MTRPFRFLAHGDNNSESETIDYDSIVIMATLLCALICILGLVLVARCARARRFSLTTATTAIGEQRAVAAANKGLKKKILRSLPILSYSSAEKFTECPICLSDFATGDEVRVLPQCGHGFHVGCIDMWLGSHLSCPSCRQILVASARCQNCGRVPTTTCGCGSNGGGGMAEREVGMNESEEVVMSTHHNSFLP